MSIRTKPAGALRDLFARSDDPYAGGDLTIAGRLGALLWVIGTAITWLLLPLAPPDAAIGGWGWAVAGATTFAGLVGARWIARGTVPWNQLLVTSYVAVVQIALLDWLAGGSTATYAELHLLVALYAGAVHPPRRVIGVLAAIAAASATPLLYTSVSTERLGQMGLRFILLAAVALLASALMRTVRAQRVGLRDRSDHAEHLARVDDLTGLPNRRAFVAALAAETSRAARFGTPLTLVVADLDDFKRINDVHGHPAGDASLRAVAEAMCSTLRQYDSCFRWGGDEFALLLPGTAAQEAEVVCARLTAAVGASSAPDGSSLSVTCAPAQWCVGMSPDALVAQADAALLERKQRRTSPAVPA